MNKKGICALSLCMMVVAGSAIAEKVPYDIGNDYAPAGDCPTDGYKIFDGEGGAIPDCDPAGFSASVSTDDDGATIDDVILSVEMAHTWVGDLRVLLSYDVECDGMVDAGPAAALCRPALDGCAVDGCCGCSGEIGGLYLFSDDAALPLAEDCAALLAGCYTTAIDSENPLAVFDGLDKGGCFELFATDGACADTGSIASWSVAVANGGGTVPTENVSWGSIKSAY